MRVLNVNSSLDRVAGGGTAERTFQMSHFLAEGGVSCTVLTGASGVDMAIVEGLRPAKVVCIPLLWKRFHVPQPRWRTIKTLVAEADVIHLMGHWSVLNAAVYFAARRAGKPYVVCPAGALPIFGRSGCLKRMYNFLIGKALVRNASACIAVTASEFAHFENYGVPASKVTVIPNGVREDEFPKADLKAFRVKKSLPDAPIILFMGRLSPIKGPDLLLQAFALAKKRIPNYHLVFAGPDEGMQSGLMEFARRENIAESVHFLGFVHGADKSAAYQLASLLVVPSRQEAMSIVALEAGVCGTAVLLTDQCGFADVQAVDLRLEVPATASAIAIGLIALLLDADVLAQLGPVWKRFVTQRYTWSVITPRYLALYRDVLAEAASK